MVSSESSDEICRKSCLDFFASMQRLQRVLGGCVLLAVVVVVIVLGRGGSGDLGRRDRGLPSQWLISRGIERVVPGVPSRLVTVQRGESGGNGDGKGGGSEDRRVAVRRALASQDGGEGGPKCTSIVTASSSRSVEWVTGAFTSWLEMVATWSPIEEIIFVEWVSDESAPSLARDLEAAGWLGPASPVTFVRVLGGPWSLTRAFNLGLSLVSCPDVFKLDIDYRTHPDFPSRHPLVNPSVFYAGNWAIAHPDPGEDHLAGALVASAALLSAVGGYDERIFGYGWDDDNIYTRLVNAGGDRVNLKYDFIRHLPHPRSAVASGVGSEFVSTMINMVFASIAPVWSSSSLHSTYSFTPILGATRGSHIGVLATPQYIVPSFQVQYSARMDQVLSEATYIALSSKGFDSNFIASLSLKDRQTLIQSLYRST